VSLDAIETGAALHTIADQWLPGDEVDPPMHDNNPEDLASIVYTSGTTGNPKGVMLSHHNIVWSCYAGLGCTDVYREDLFLSFLPLSHMFERNVGYYLPIMAGATVAFNRSIPQLAEDLMTVQPTLLVSVPRIYEQIYNKIMAKLDAGPVIKKWLFKLTVAAGWRSFQFSQGRIFWHPLQLLTPLLRRLVAKKITCRLGGRMRLSLCGGAAMPLEIAKTFLGLGVTMAQGYGLTESSPTVSFNRLHDNVPESVGEPLPGVQIKLGDKNELLVRSPAVMIGYWQHVKATREAIDTDGWLHTGDKVRIENNHIYITGRLKEILVLSNGEIVPPSDIEAALDADVLIDQAVIIGDNRPFLSAILVLNPNEWQEFAGECEVDPQAVESLQHSRVKQKIIKRLDKRMRHFPGYARILRVILELEPWTVENGLLTPTLKARRPRIIKKYANDIDALYRRY
jgi:long-chain acyl-CoA synthetase